MGTPLTHERFLRRSRGTVRARAGVLCWGRGRAAGAVRCMLWATWRKRRALRAPLLSTRAQYGAAISARGGTWPGAATPLPGLSVCGDSCMPGIGVPAAVRRLRARSQRAAPALRGLLWASRPPARPARGKVSLRSCQWQATAALLTAPLLCPPHAPQAASGMIAANSLAPVWSHLGALDELKL